MPADPHQRRQLETLCRIAAQAGEAILHFYRRMKSGTAAASSVLVAHKDDSSPLTLADQAAHRVIVDGLQAMDPLCAIVSEEDAASHTLRRPQGLFWLVDPLDGTKEFLAGTDEFTVNVALIRDGMPVLGVVHAPALDQTYVGGRSLGAWRIEGDQWRALQACPPRLAGAPLRILASKSHMNAATEAFISRLGPHELVQAGSSLKFCRIAEGRAQVYPRLGPTCEWDTAAAQAVVEGAGGHVVCLDGSPLRYGKISLLNPDFVVTAVAPEQLPGVGPQA